MRVWIYTLLLLTACDSGREKPVAPAREQRPADPEKAADPSVRYFTGTLNNRIPVFVWLNDSDSLVEGAVTYTAGKNPAPIRLLGDKSPEGYYLHEYGPDGAVTGIWSGTKVGDGMKGTWYSPVNNQEFSFVLQKKDTSLSSVPGMEVRGDVSGEYRYQYGEEGAMGVMYVKQPDPGHIIYNIDANRGAPSYNMAIVEEDTLELQGNTAVYSAADEFGKCRFRIRFFNGFAVIDHPTEEYECGFGHNATVSGYYIRTGGGYRRQSPEGAEQ